MEKDVSIKLFSEFTPKNHALHLARDALFTELTFNSDLPHAYEKAMKKLYDELSVKMGEDEGFGTTKRRIPKAS
jgi:hypothetical protein